MNEISSLPSLTDLLSQNPNLKPNLQAERLAQNFENRSGEIGGIGQMRTGATSPIQLDRTSPVDRVTAPGFAQMFEKFIKGVDQKKKISAKETQDLILGRSTIFMRRWSNLRKQVSFNLMIEVRNKLVESYKELMRMQV